MERSIPRAEDIYKHFKGKLYQIITIAKHSETGEDLVIYRALYGDFKSYAGSLSMFLSEVDKAKYPEVSTKYRFTKMVPTSAKETHSHEVQENREPIAPNENPVPTPPPVSTEKSESEDARAMALFMEFLDETGFDKKRNILRAISPIATSFIINSMAASLDLIPSGNPDADLKMIHDYISARIHFDGSRLR